MKSLRILGILLFLTMGISAQDYVLHCGNLIDTKTGKMKTEMSVVIEGNKITQVASGYIELNPKITTIDLKDKTVMPGLIDLHVHLEMEMNPKRYIERFTLNEA